MYLSVGLRKVAHVLELAGAVTSLKFSRVSVTDSAKTF